MYKYCQSGYHSRLSLSETTDRRSVCQSVLVASRIWRPRTHFAYSQTLEGLFMLGCPLLLEEWSVLYIWCWSSLAQSYLPSSSSSCVTTDCHSASSSWCQASICGPRPDFYYCRTFVVFMLWGALPDERAGLWFTRTIHCHSPVQVPQNSWSHLRLPRPGGPGPRIYIPHEQGGPVIPSDPGLPFLPPLIIHIYLPESKLYYDQQSVGQSFLVSGTHVGLATNISFSLKFYIDSCGFIILYLPLWREDRSVIYCYCWSSPAHRKQLSLYSTKTDRIEDIVLLLVAYPLPRYVFNELVPSSGRCFSHHDTVWLFALYIIKIFSSQNRIISCGYLRLPENWKYWN
jgi:hypothetical protein